MNKINEKYTLVALTLVVLTGVFIFFPVTPPSWPKYDKYVGFRCNNGYACRDGTATISYPMDYWVSVAKRYKAMFPGTVGVAAWVIAEPQVVSFDQATDDRLTDLDKSGVYVFLSVGDEDAHYAVKYTRTVDELIDLTLSKYGSHPCVLGFGVCVESIVGGPQIAYWVSDAEASRWLNKIQNYNSNFKMYIKHWSYTVMPPTFRRDIIFVDIFCGFDDLSAMMSNFQAWGNHFSGAEVGYAIGYSIPGQFNDWGNWIQYIDDPAYTITNEIFRSIPNCKWVYWTNVNYDSLKGVFP